MEALADGLTLLTICLANRPFILDSILAEVNVHDVDVELIAHPVIDSKSGRSISLIMVVLTQTSAAERKDLKASLSGILQQVKLVTGDWRSMLLRVDEELETFRATPPPLPTEQIAEAIQFLQWLTNNNFTFMGLREYFLQRRPKVWRA